MALTGDTMSTTQQKIEERLRELISEAARRIAAEIAPACPTSGFLEALSSEIEAAKLDPKSVPYPELVDPDTYWEASVRPQGLALRAAVDEILSWLEAGVVSIMEVAEADMKATVDAAIAQGGADPATVRDILDEEMGRRCLELHHLMAEILTVVPSRAAIEKSRTSYEDRLRAEAVADVGELKTAYLEAAGGDESHQQFAEQQWSDTHSDRVAYREALLRAAPPWRHQEIAIVGHERVCAAIDQSVGEVVERLQSPLADMSVLLIQRYDSAGSGRGVPQ